MTAPWRWIGLGCVALGAGMSVAMYHAIPPIAPVPWKVEGSRLVLGVEGHGTPAEVCWVIPIVSLVVWLLAAVIPRIDPRRRFDEFASTYWKIVCALLAFGAVSQCLLLFHAAGELGDMRRYFAVVLGALLAVVGNYVTRIRPNWFVGLRTPWTLSNDAVWQRTNRVAAWGFVLGGFVLCALGVTTTISLTLLTAIIVAAVSGASALYSYLVWRRDTPATGGHP